MNRLILMWWGLRFCFSNRLLGRVYLTDLHTGLGAATVVKMTSEVVFTSDSLNLSPAPKLEENFIL